MSKIDFQTELHRKSGLVTTLTIKEHDYDAVEFTVKKFMADESGKVIVDSSNRMFFTPRELKDFLQPLIDELKVRFDNANSIQK